MRRYTGDAVAIAAIVAGALGSYALHQRMVGPHTADVIAPVGPMGIIMSTPAHRPHDAMPARVPDGRVLRFTAVSPAGEVYLVRPGAPDLRVNAGTLVLLGGDGLFDGVFRTHGVLRKIHLEVEVVTDGKVTSKASVSSIRPHVGVTRGGISVFGF